MRTFIRDILYGLRIAFKNPIMLITSTACLGIGIGIFLLMFIPLNTLMIKPLPFTDSHELIWVHESHPKHNYQIMSVSYLNYLDWKSSITCVEELAAFMKQDISVERGETSQRIVGTYVTRDFFKLLDLSPDFGQFPDSKDDWIDSDGMEKIVISYSFWSRYFDKGPVINETIILGGISHRIVGIMPENYEIPSGSDVWMRLRLDPQAIPRDTHFLWVIGRLRNDVSLNEASAQIQKVSEMLSERYPDTNTNVRAVVKPIRELFVQIPEKNFWLALVAVVPIFFIACFNVANLILSRGTFRQKEYALRIVFGATRFRVIRQLLAESMGLALSGGIAAILISMWAVDFMVPSFFYFIPAFFSFNMSGNVLAVAVLCIIAAGLLIGLLASFQIPMKGYHEILKEGGGNIPYDARKVPIRNLLVAAEIALAFILMIGAGMNVKNYSNIKRVHPGFDCINILTMQLTLPESKYQTDQQINDFYQLVIQRIEMIDGVISTGINQQIPLRSRLGWEVEYSLENQAASEQRLNPHANYQVVSPDYFKTLGIPLKSGRFFLYGDSKYAEDVAIISQSLADYLWPTEEILGKKLKLGDPDSRETWLTIVGIVGNIRHRGLDRDVTYDLYVSCFQHPVETFTIVTRVKDDTSGYIDAIKEAIADVDRHLSVYNVLSMKEVLSNTLDEPRAFTVLAFTFAALALILATIGVYGTLSYSVSQRSHPIGIKIALGAQKSHILRDIIKKFSRLLLTGLLGGILGAILSSYLKTDLLVGETSFDPSVYIFSSIILIATLASAAYLPAIRALQINPVEVLRYE